MRTGQARTGSAEASNPPSRCCWKGFRASLASPDVRVQIAPAGFERNANSLGESMKTSSAQYLMKTSRARAASENARYRANTAGSTENRRALL